MKKSLILLTPLFLCVYFCTAQQVGSSAAYIKAVTSQWKGDRLEDGRPKVSDGILQRLKKVAMEEAWGYLRGHGYQNQYEGNWKVLHSDSAMTGRVVTAQYMPERPDLEKVVRQAGLSEGRDSSGGMNSWPINILKPGDVYVADGYDRIIDGTLIGSNLGNAIYANSKNGVIFYGSVRDEGGLSEIKGFNAWTRGQDPSYLQQEMLTSINAPIRIGRAIVLPGDVVLANKYGTIFIPAYLVNDLVLSGEVTHLRDEFGFQRLREKKYTAGEIDSKWSKAIEEDFSIWLKNRPDSDLPMTRKELNDYLQAKKAQM
jgi:4-hydroxy-4-methyl-2-oxoglutarate aldolase